MNSLELFIPIVAIVFSHALIFGVLFVYFRNRNRERTLMIEKGVDPSVFMAKPKNSASTALKYGLFMAGLAIGILMGGVIASATTLPEPVAYFSMILLFGGFGLLTYYVIEKRNDNSANG